MKKEIRFLLVLLFVVCGFGFINLENAYAGYSPEDTITISGSKTWDDQDNADGIRPSSITINLLANGEWVDSMQVTAETGWSYSFYNLPAVDENIDEIIYKISEDPVEGYATIYTGGYNVTNTHTPEEKEDEPETIEVSGTKSWIDQDNADGIRPNSVTINLLANGEWIASKQVSAETDWSYTFGELPKNDDLGNTISYAVSEEPVEGYVTSINGFNVVNTHFSQDEPVIENVTISGRKIWNDENDKDGIRPSSITVNVLANGEVVKTTSVTAETGWSYTFGELPKFDEFGNIILYTVTENPVAGYETRYNNYDIMNIHVPEESETVSISGHKSWNDNDNADGIRPENIMINLFANGADTGMSKLVNDYTEWAYSFNDLPKNDANGEEIVYTITENPVEGYEVAYVKTEIGFDLVNTHNAPKPELITLTIKKVWNDQNNIDGIRPELITVHLLANGQVARTVAIQASDNWTMTISGLEKFDNNGTEIIYTVKENAVDGYETTYDGLTITNTHTPKAPENTPNVPTTTTTITNPKTPSTYIPSTYVPSAPTRQPLAPTGDDTNSVLVTSMVVAAIGTIGLAFTKRHFF